MLSKKFKTWLLLIWTIYMLLGASLYINSKIIESHYWKLIRSLQPQDIQKIEFYAINDGDEVGALLRSIDDDATIKKISQYLSQAISDLPSRRIYAKEVYAVFYLTNGNKFEFVFRRMDEPDKTVYIEFMEIDGNLTSYYGRALTKDPRFLEFLESLNLLK